MATHLSPEEQAEGFAPLFNGKDLNDWKIIGPEEGWEVQNGLMVCNGEGRGWIRPKATYTDFVLRLDYRNSAGGNNKSNGAIYDAVAPTVDPSHPAGEWNAIEVSCQGTMVNVIINGREVISCDTSKHPDLKDRLKTGYIGLQNHRSPIDFRNVRIKV